MSTEKKKTTVKDLEVVHDGTQIILPVINGKPMTNAEGIEWLRRKDAEDQQEVALHHVIKGSPMDGAVAFQRAIAEQYGWSQAVPTPGFFGDRPPHMISVPVSDDDILQVPWGRIEIPGIDGFFQTAIQDDPEPCLIIGGKIKKKNEKEAKKLFALTEKFLKEKSIYKGSAIKISFDWAKTNGDDERVRGYDPLQDAPRFMSLKGIKDDDLIFGERVIAALNIGLFTPIEQADACREHGVPLKRGILLYGPYGTGKTLTAYVTALKAVRNGWTFIYLDSVKDLKRGLDFAAQYAPAVIFAEDIDRAVHGDRSMSMDEVLNTIDGIDTKTNDIITVFTTNHVEQINPAMLRPGRLDTLVEVTPPDAKAAERLVTLYSRDLLAPNVDLKKVGLALAGKIPALIREVTERAKIAAIARLGANIKGHVREEDLLNGAMAMEAHVSMLTPRESESGGNAEMFLRVPANSTEISKAMKRLQINGGTDTNKKSA